MKQSYLDQLTRAAHWRLPLAEAREVVEDYTAMLAEDLREDEALRREVGEPVQAVRELTQWRSYARWLAGFAGLLACLLLPQLATLPGMDRLLRLLEGTSVIAQSEFFFLVLGLAGVLLLRRRGERTGACPKAIPLLLVLQLTGIAVLWVLIYLMLAMPMGIGEISVEQAQAIIMAIRVWTLLLTLLGAVGLVQFRLADRRWLAVYMLGLTVAVLGLAALSLVWAFHLDNIGEPGWWQPFFGRYLLLTVLGLGGTGAALC